MPSCLGEFSHAVAIAALLPCFAIHTVLFDSSWRRVRSEPQISLDINEMKQILPPIATSLSVDSFDDIAILGMGSFGKVSVVKHKVSGQCYALKTLTKASFVSPKVARQAIRERDVMEAVQHPFVATYCGSFQDPTNLYLLSEYIPGGDMYRYLMEGPTRLAGTLDTNAIRFYAANIAKALHGLHSQGVLYRDLKLENTMIDCHGYIKLIDMGFAKQLDMTPCAIGTDRRTLTVCGTPDFMAPEILLGNGYGMAVDFWALGVVLYEIVTGESLFYRDDGNHSKMMARIKAVAVDGLPLNKALFSQVDVHIRDFILGLLTYDPTMRLGCTATGFKSIENHPLFHGTIDWAALLAKQIPSPYVPHIDHATDTKHFHVIPPDCYDEWCDNAIDVRVAEVFEGF